MFHSQYHLLLRGEGVDNTQEPRNLLVVATLLLVVEVVAEAEGGVALLRAQGVERDMLDHNPRKRIHRPIAIERVAHSVELEECLLRGIFGCLPIGEVAACRVYHREAMLVGKYLKFAFRHSFVVLP